MPTSSPTPSATTTAAATKEGSTRRLCPNVVTQSYVGACDQCLVKMSTDISTNSSVRYVIE